MTEAQKMKQAALVLLHKRMEGKRQMLADIDDRLLSYFDDMCTYSSADAADLQDYHNVYEVLGGCRFLRLLETYPFNRKKVQMLIRMREGEWRRDGQRWVHVSGGLKCPGATKPQVYRWQPFQVFVLASVFGFYAWVDEHVRPEDKAELLPTERVRDGGVWDYRRLCTEFTYFGPRKTDKTGLAAFIQFVFFFFEDFQSESYCCANSSDQAKLLYSRTRDLILQMDDGDRIRSTQTVTDWRQAYKSVHDSSVRPLSAGGKAKDGMFAQLCCADEFGSAPYTNGKSDMLNLVNVIQSSMGPRREPLTFITTTAGTIQTGPFIDKLEAIHAALRRELTYDDGTLEALPDFESDRRLCLCLEPDEWECDEESILNKRSIRYKVNPMLGLIVQHASYDGWISEARADSAKMPELMAKYFNRYTVAAARDWLTADDIRPLQVEMRVDDCTADKGWMVFAGLDFSKGDDLNGVSYLAYHQPTGTFIADMDSYMSEKAVNDSPIRELLLKWAADGWLHVVPGQTFDPSWPVNRIVELDGKGVEFVLFGYDPYNAEIVMNALRQWLFDIGVDPTNAIRSVRQNFATYTPAVQELDYYVKRCSIDAEGRRVADPIIHFSPNPLWPWEFGNVSLRESVDGMENLKPVKRQPGSAACKVDNVQMLLSALILYMAVEKEVG